MTKSLIRHKNSKIILFFSTEQYRYNFLGTLCTGSYCFSVFYQHQFIYYYINPWLKLLVESHIFEAVQKASWICNSSSALNGSLKTTTKTFCVQKRNTYPKYKPHNAKTAEEVEHVGPISTTRHQEARHEGTEDVTNLSSSKDEGPLSGPLMGRYPSG